MAEEEEGVFWRVTAGRDSVNLRGGSPLVGVAVVGSM